MGGGESRVQSVTRSRERLVSLRGSLQQRLVRLWNTCGYCQFDFKYHPGDSVRASSVPHIDRTKVVCVEFRPQRIVDYMIEISQWCRYYGWGIMGVETDEAVTMLAYLQREPLDQQECDLAALLKFELPDA